jgi:hypothetical protein
MSDPTIHDLKIQNADACIREHLSHVKPRGYGCYATRKEALAAAWKTLSTSGLDTAQMTEAFEQWAKEMDTKQPTLTRGAKR